MSYKIPEPLSVFWRMVSLTVANTCQIFVMFVACIKCGYALSCVWFSCMKSRRMYPAALLMSGLPMHLGKYTRTRGKGQYTLRMALKMLALFKNKMMEVFENHHELMTLSQRAQDSLPSGLSSPPQGAFGCTCRVWCKKICL